MSESPIRSSRRNLLKGAATFAAAAPLVGTLEALSVRQAHAAAPARQGRSPYGAIAPVKDLATGLELLQLPEGFQYSTFSWRGDPMADGNPVPGGHDGMGVVEVRRGIGGMEIVLVRNHELGTGVRIGAPAVFDSVVLGGSTIAGGTTNLYFSPSGVRTEPSLGGTRSNCAGGVTPWGTWLTCEENTSDHTASGGNPHGYVFEVTADPARTTGMPLTALGRFKHEAVAIDPATGIVYETEDNSDRAGYYRFVPNDRSQRTGSLAAGGTLQAAKIKGVFQGDLRDPVLGTEHELEWVDIPNPDSAPVGSDSGPWFQARAAGAARMRRGEGIWFHAGKLYIVDTSGGAAREGTVWMHDPATDRITCIFVSSGKVAANNPDNLTVSPRGGLLLCEDGGGVEDEFGYGNRMLGLTRDGEAYVFAKNNAVFTDEEAIAAGKRVAGGDYRSSEFAGACFDPTGHYLFVNTQSPGITYAIWGPWSRGTI